MGDAARKRRQDAEDVGICHGEINLDPIRSKLYNDFVPWPCSAIGINWHCINPSNYGMVLRSGRVIWFCTDCWISSKRNWRNYGNAIEVQARNATEFGWGDVSFVESSEVIERNDYGTPRPAG